MICFPSGNVVDTIVVIVTVVLTSRRLIVVVLVDVVVVVITVGFSRGLYAVVELTRWWEASDFKVNE